MQKIKINYSQFQEQILLPYCSLLRSAVDVRNDSNSIIHCSQWFPFKEIATACFPNVPYEDIKIGINFVEIDGNIPSSEELHIHISMLIAIVVFGKGLMLYEKDGIQLSEEAEAGDMIFVPRNAPHYFEGLPKIKYAAIEFGPLIDYQKHHPKSLS